MNALKRLVGGLWRVLVRAYRLFRSIVLNLLFIFLLLGLVAALALREDRREPMPADAALILDPAGTIVDQLTYADPVLALLSEELDGGGSVYQEVLLQDLLDALAHAAEDDAISSLVLQLEALLPSGFSKLQDLARALDDFKGSGKKIYAIGDYYTQGQYYLAAHADEIILNPYGMVDLEGFSSYQIYFREALDKLGVNMHIFRVGEYKSAVEPFERNDMSEPAREANRAWLGDLWEQYADETAAARQLPPGFIDDYINNMDERLAEHEGDLAALALGSGLVDSLRGRVEINAHLVEEIGAADPAPISQSMAGESDEDYPTFPKIGFHDYLDRTRNGPFESESQADKIGLIVARGIIYDGERRAGEIGGDSLSRLIRRASANDEIKALVLRIDSGGGSAFASDVIRGELASLKEAGKPIVVSMGSVAASGGYWISTPADEIWASPSTITGSIGIFGLLPTFEGAFDSLGISTDGVGTTEMAGAFSLGRELPELASNVLQLSVEEGYQRFINLVAEARGMTPEEVDAIAQGRVWSGMDALELGLIDNLGDLDDAIAAAAGLAGLEDYETELIERRLSPGELLVQNIVDNIQWLGREDAAAQQPFALTWLYQRLKQEARELHQYNDPRNLYLRCLECKPLF